MCTWHQPSKKAPLVGAFFIGLIWLSLASADDCSPPATTEAVQIRYVHDGDSLVLSDNRKIRLIGINTPELAHQDRPSQALAIDARNHLRQRLFQHGNRAQLLYGKQQRDEHKRNLAHLWLPDRSNVAAELLGKGLAWAIAIPPNVRYLDCYLRAEQKARSASRGVWSHPDHAPRNSSDLSLRDEGFQRIHGRVIRVNRGGGATWLNLEGRFALRVPDADIQRFKKPPDSGWVGRDIEVLGWLYAVKDELRVTVRHPAALRLSD